MVNVFVSKVRPLGSSLGVIIPRKIVKSGNLFPGKEVQLSLLEQDFSALDRLFGSVPNAKPFKRDRRIRV